MFAHKNNSNSTNFLRFVTSTNSITLSAKHLIFIKNIETKNAESVAVGEVIFVTDDEGLQLKEMKVEKIFYVVESGFFAPFTLSGTIVVDGVLASCYAQVKDFGQISGHNLAHLVLSPLRLANRLGLTDLLNSFDVDKDDKPEVINVLMRIFGRQLSSDWNLKTFYNSPILTQLILLHFFIMWKSSQI